MVSELDSLVVMLTFLSLDSQLYVPRYVTFHIQLQITVLSKALLLDYCRS